MNKQVLKSGGHEKIIYPYLFKVENGCSQKLIRQFFGGPWWLNVRIEAVICGKHFVLRSLLYKKILGTFKLVPQAFLTTINFYLYHTASSWNFSFKFSNQLISRQNKWPSGGAWSSQLSQVWEGLNKEVIQDKVSFLTREGLCILARFCL